MAERESSSKESQVGESRQLALLCSDLHDFHHWTQQLGDVAANRLARRWFALQEIIITRGGAGQVIQFGSNFLCATFDRPSDALNRALEIQRVLSEEAPAAPPTPEPGPGPGVRIGLHLGEVLLQQGEHVEIVSRHLNRAQRLMEAAGPGQIYASEAVIEAGRDFIDVPNESLCLPSYGEYYLKGAGATAVYEVADLRVRRPEPPRLAGNLKAESALAGRLEMAGYASPRRLGEGPTGVVYEATQRDTDGPVAVKVLAPALWDTPAARQRLEVLLARWRQHPLPGTVRLMADRLDHHPPFLVLERVTGQPLAAALTDAPPERVARVFRSICHLLAPAHAEGWVHGGLKPTNIFLCAEDTPVLMDFGLAALLNGHSDAAAAGNGQAESETPTTSDGPAAGALTPSDPDTVAPEVIAGRARTPQSDIYALGVVLFQVLTGRKPFAGRSIHETAQAHLNEDPPLPGRLHADIPDGLQRICLKALEKTTAERYARVQDLAADLDRFLGGEVVRTRPTTYDNLLFHRVRQHVRQVQDWFNRGLLNEEESHRLLAAYDGLQRRGMPAVMESNLYRFWQILVYAGGWAVVNGALLWLVLHWETLSRAQKLLLGSVPALTAFALGLTMLRLERFRLTFVALVVGVVAVPLLAGVWLYEFHIGAAVPEDWLSRELLYTGDAVWLTNIQIFVSALITFLVAAVVGLYTRTTTHSAQAMLAFVLLYSAELLFFELRPHLEHEQWATLGLQYLPLLCFAGGAIYWLLRQPDRAYQAAPWILLSAALVIGISDVLALHGLREWTDWPRGLRRPVGYFLLSLAGIVQAGAGLSARRYLQHRGRFAVLILVFSGLVHLLAGLALAGFENNWPASWWSPVVLGKSVPITHLVLPFAALAIALLACRFQMFTFLGLGLAGFAASVHLLAELYFQQIAGWPKWIMLVGAICFFAALWIELKRTRGNPVADAVGQKRL